MKKETKEQVCEKCEYYLQHYIKYNVKFRKINCGHCVCPDNNLTKKRFWGDGCIHFKEKTATKDVEQRAVRLTKL